MTIYMVVMETNSGAERVYGQFLDEYGAQSCAKELEKLYWPMPETNTIKVISYRVFDEQELRRWDLK